MKDYEASEAAYKNGYELGKKIKQSLGDEYESQFIKGILRALKGNENDDRKR